MKKEMNVKKERDIGTLLDDSMKEYKLNRKLIFKIFVIYGIITLILTIFSSIVGFNMEKSIGGIAKSPLEFKTFFSPITGNQITNTNTLADFNQIISYLPFLILFGIISFILYIFITLFTITLSLFHNNGKISFKELKSRSLPKFWNYLGFILVIILFLLVFLLIFFVIILIIGLMGQMGTVILVIGIILGILLIIGLICIFLWLALSWTFAPYFLFGQNNSIMNSLRNSHYLVKGKWWKTFGYTLVIIIICFVISLIINIVGGIITLPLLLFGRSNIFIYVIVNLISQFFNIISFAITYPFMTFYLKNIYLDRKK